MLNHLNRVQQMIPPNLEKLFIVRIHRINQALAPGLYLHDWYCSSFDKWIEVRRLMPFHYSLEMQFQVVPLIDSVMLLFKLLLLF